MNIYTYELGLVRIGPWTLLLH